MLYKHLIGWTESCDIKTSSHWLVWVMHIIRLAEWEIADNTASLGFYCGPKCQCIGSVKWRHYGYDKIWHKSVYCTRPPVVRGGGCLWVRIPLMKTGRRQQRLYHRNCPDRGFLKFDKLCEKPWWTSVMVPSCWAYTKTLWKSSWQKRKPCSPGIETLNPIGVIPPPAL
jgi:hypothetical protein